MIPSTAGDLDTMIEEVARQTKEVRGMLGVLSGASLNWRPQPTNWSVGGHVAHMCIVNGPYLPAMERALAKSRARGLVSEGPYRHPWFGRWFAGLMEPPPKRRMGTAKAMVPDPTVDGADLMNRFSTVQGELRQLMADARGVDLGKTRFSSPFARVVRLSVGTGMSVLLAHNRRHIWLAREVIDQPGFPTG